MPRGAWKATLVTRPNGPRSGGRPFFPRGLRKAFPADALRGEALGSQRRAAAVTTLLAASRTLSAATGRDAVARALAEQVSAAAGGRATVLLPEGEELAPIAGAPSLEPLDAAQMAAARWAWEKGEAAGFGTGTLPQARWTF